MVVLEIGYDDGRHRTSQRAILKLTISKDLELLDDSEREELSFIAQSVLDDQLDILHAACAIYKIARLNNIDRLKPFKYLWAVDSECRELPMDESCRYGRHPDLLKRLDKEMEELADYYRDKVTETCRIISESLPPKNFKDSG